MKKNLIVLQKGNKDCGAACLLSIIRYYGGDVSLDRLIDMTKTTKEGTNFYNLNIAASDFKLISKSFKVDDLEKLKKLETPFIAQINNKNYMHFVVIYKINNNKIIIMDPSIGKNVVDIFDFSNSWTGYIMTFEKYSNVPLYKEEKVLNRIIKNVIIKNSNIIIFLIILSIISTVITCFVGLYSQIVFDKIINTNLNNLIIITIIFSVLFIVKNITNFIHNHLFIFFNQKIDLSIMISTYSKIILLPYKFYKNKTTAEVLSRINDLSYLKNFISKIIILFFLDSLTFIVSLFIIYSVSDKILLILLLMLLVYLTIIILSNKVIRDNIVINQENKANVNNLIIESVSMFETVKGLNIQNNMIFKFSKLYSKLLDNLYYSEKVSNIVLTIKEFVTDIGLLIVNFITIMYIMNNKLTIGNYMTISLLASYLIYPIKNLIDIIDEYHYVKNAIKRGNGLLEYEDEIINKKETMLVNGNIKVDNLSYSFNNKYYVLNNMNFFIKDKEKVIILGESGTGKSTVMKLLYKYYEVERNKIYINNYDINDYSLSDIRKNITYISQNEMLFTGSIRDNILLDRNISELEFLNVCKILRIDEIVKNNILGYDYFVEEGGNNLSGGQRQRIILARSLLKNSNIIIIDEGFNQIDIKLEKEILNDIFSYYYDKTIIIISHRKENAELYDRVIKINNGSVKEIEERNRCRCI